jgi:hypothetical protein
MPSTTVEPILNLSMAPSGKLLAVTGSNDIEIFWFNGASPMKAYKTLLSGVDIDMPTGTLPTIYTRSAKTNAASTSSR